MSRRYALVIMFVVGMLALGQPVQAVLAEIARVTNLRSSVNAGMVTLHYDLESPFGSSAQVRFTLSVDGGKQWHEVKGVSGDVGPGIVAGKNKRIVWDIGQAYPKGYTGPVIYEVQTRAEREQGIALALCQRLFDSNRLLTGRGANAVDCYDALLQRDPGNLAAMRGLLSIEMKYLDWAERALAAGRLAKAKRYLGKLEQLNPDGDAVAQIREGLAQARRRAKQQSRKKQTKAKRRVVSGRVHFSVTSRRYSEKVSNDAACKSEFGSASRLADWADLVAYSASDPTMGSFIQQIGMLAEGQAGYKNYHVSWNGKTLISGFRHPFVVKHDHVAPGYFMVHDDIDHHMIDLGSWNGAMPALCVD